jgi:hypothetical protein
VRPIRFFERFTQGARFVAVVKRNIGEGGAADSAFPRRKELIVVDNG